MFVKASKNYLKIILFKRILEVNLIRPFFFLLVKGLNFKSIGLLLFFDSRLKKLQSTLFS